MDDAFLNLRPGIDRLDRLGDCLEIVHRKNQNVLDAPVLQLIQDREPVLGGFCLADPQPQAFLLPVQVDPEERAEYF